MFDHATLDSIRKIANSRNIDYAALAAITEVESAGHAFASVDGRNMPPIRIEGHYFDKLVPAAKRDQARAAKLAHPTAGRIKNPKSQQARYDMLGRMMAIDEAAAIMSCSWGVGQVMGSHWDKLGFRSAADFYRFVTKNVANQVDVMVRYIERFGLMDEIERRDWSGFARGYNGPQFARYGYHTKIAAAFARYNGGNAGARSPAAGMLRMGSKGAGVRELQALLARAGQVLVIDGDFGPSTRDALKRFQLERGLVVDGVAGPATMKALKAFQVDPEERPGDLPAMKVPEVNDAVKATGPIAIIAGIRDQVAETATYLLGVDSDWAYTIANALLTGTAAIGTGLAIWGFYGWWKSRRTLEQ